jgi:perosamine synthetase
MTSAKDRGVSDQAVFKPSDDGGDAGAAKSTGTLSPRERDAMCWVRLLFCIGSNSTLLRSTRRRSLSVSSLPRITMGSPAIGEEEIAAVTAVLRSGKLREGELARQFEEAFAAAEGAAWAVTTNSGSSALLASYMTLIQPGDEVLVPGFGFIATASMVVAAGGVPVFCEIDPQTATMLPEEVERRSGPRTRACAPVHIFGHPVAIEPLQLACRQRGLRIIWDAAQAHGAAYHGRRMASFPDLTVYSFYPSKNMTTGEGGMVTGHDPALRQRIARLKDHGSVAPYDHRSLGYNWRSSEIAAAIGLAQLAKLDAANRARRLNASRMTSHLGGLRAVRVPCEQPGCTSVYHQYTIVLDLERLTIDRSEFARRLNERGIATAVHYPLPVYHQPALADYSRDTLLPNCSELARRVLSLPIHPGLTTDDVDRIALAVRDVHDEALR